MTTDRCQRSFASSNISGKTVCRKDDCPFDVAPLSWLEITSLIDYIQGASFSFIKKSGHIVTDQVDRGEDGTREEDLQADD